MLNDEEAEAACKLPASWASKPLRFRARFLGSHDDSVVSLRAVQVDGVHVSCREGSKTGSRFEDGEVTLDCGFTAPARVRGGELKVSIAMHHLQLDRTDIAVE